ncbi:MAG: hypothetical protein JNL88_06500, partial [Bacteroidia bacterium]|nr:hypothetical protein [Bacteroidia bacterium]
MKIRILLSVILTGATLFASAQSAFIPLSNTVEQPFYHDLNRVGNNLHTSFKPFLRSDVVDAMVPPPEDSAALAAIDYGRRYDSLISIPLRQEKKFNRTLVGRKIFSEHLLQVEEKDFRLYLDPVFEFTGGLDQNSDSSFYYNTRGVWVNGSVGK